MFTNIFTEGTNKIASIVVAMIIATTMWTSPGLVQGGKRYIKVFVLSIIQSIKVPKRNFIIVFFLKLKVFPLCAGISII
ncbi:hypothetical protein VT91_03830 [Clostridium sporogenes]|uniref:hypothetical protein n=1 Tax=Clostridium botulinum TaxID=1491 RepID=UPI000717A0BB|nr:hypothetical protein [Clostridium botulinum]KRU26766.1 hypothetical protein VT28_29910 [Clostridium sporogenes]KRU29630.1 hypothetical protein WG71_14750 [Clostridium sporogenes]KRU35395.1 hypothetical protein VT91_03830 [Clostridium sporogenes]MCW6070876.1 hypothetical protein [Clostridium botulinum]OQP90041.1 hypothetical protein VT92_0201770 [Clostridium sporogenes]